VELKVNQSVFIAVTLFSSLAAGSPSMAQSEQQTHAPISSGRSAAAPMSAQHFAGTVSELNQFELQAAQFAVEKAQSPAVRQYAERIVQDRTKVRQNLEKTLNREDKGQPAFSRQAAQNLNQLKNASGKDFDRKFLEIMADRHREDIKLLRAYKTNGSDPATKAFAVQTLPTLLSDGAYAGGSSRKGRWVGNGASSGFVSDVTGAPSLGPAMSTMGRAR
jgi:putative membrane protein